VTDCCSTDFGKANLGGGPDVVTDLVGEAVNCCVEFVVRRELVIDCCDTDSGITNFGGGSDVTTGLVNEAVMASSSILVLFGLGDPSPKDRRGELDAWPGVSSLSCSVFLVLGGAEASVLGVISVSGIA
jgi:hypothetical protein